MAQIEAGPDPEDFKVKLAKDADFYWVLTNASGWADGIAIELRFPAPGVAPPDWISWAAQFSKSDPALLVNDVASFDVPYPDVNTAIGVVTTIGGSGRARTRLHYIDTDGHDLLWAEGPCYVI
jgi:hypothetical protein